MSEEEQNKEKAQEAMEQVMPDDGVSPPPEPVENKEAALTEEVAKYKDMYLRAMAETENVRTRARRENDDTAKYAATKFARDMVNILENLVRASESITPDHRSGSEVVKQVADGIDMTVQELTGIFERNGIKRINPVGEKFDHNFHQAVTQMESSDAEPGTVLNVLQAGYVMHDRLLRPAMVSVAKAKAADSAA